MKSTKLLAAIFSFPILLTACTPNAVTYYQPSVDGGVVVSGSCVPTKSRVKFSIGYLQFDANAFVTRRTDQLTIMLSVTPFPGQKVYFSSDQFKVYDTANMSDLSGVTVFASRPNVFKSSDTTPLAEDKSHISPGYDFSVYISFPKTDVDSFELLSPSIFIDGDEIKLPPIQFDRKMWVGISPLNC